ncbi:MAG: putative inorganic carbon transporter subunit DabA, partial [Bacteroidia bacterium]
MGDNKYFEHYLFDQQFAHQGWSGMVASIQQSPETLIDKKKITLEDLIFFELLLEIDSLDYLLGENWEPLSKKVKDFPEDIFAKVEFTEFNETLYLWQLSLEWSYYDDVLLALKTNSTKEKIIENKSFQALFCIDDRECSFRRYLEDEDANCETFGTPGFFGVDSFFQPQGGKFYTKICPAPVKPKHLIKEVGVRTKQKKEIHFSKYSQSFHSGWLISQTLGFWSTLKLAANIFMPSTGPASAASLKHMDKNSKLLVLNKDKSKKENDLQIGYTTDEMTDRVEALLKSIGLVKDFASIIYVCGHGA